MSTLPLALPDGLQDKDCPQSGINCICIAVHVVAMAANVKADRLSWHPSPSPSPQFMFIELMLICAPRHAFLMENHFISGRGVNNLDLWNKAISKCLTG
ncbi:hypothetical protein ACLKA6_003413 [Drosophila palustris]